MTSTVRAVRDLTNMTRAEQSPNDRSAYVRSIVDTVREPLVILDASLRVQSANRSFYRIFQVSPQDTEGQFLYDLGNGQWDIARLRTLQHAVSLLVDLIRTSATPQQVVAEQGFFQQTLGSQMPVQLIRVAVAPESRLVAEISTARTVEKAL